MAAMPGCREVQEAREHAYFARSVMRLTSWAESDSSTVRQGSRAQHDQAGGMSRSLASVAVLHFRALNRISSRQQHYSYANCG